MSLDITTQIQTVEENKIEIIEKERKKERKKDS